MLAPLPDLKRSGGEMKRARKPREEKQSVDTAAYARLCALERERERQATPPRNLTKALFADDDDAEMGA